MDQRELWAAPNAPRYLRLSVERLWTVADDAVSLSLAAHGTKTSEAVWMTTQELRGRHWATVAGGIAAAALVRFDGPMWDVAPKQQAQEKWERHLFTY